MTLILGGGRSGFAVYQFLQDRGEPSWVFDDRPEDLTFDAPRWISISELPRVHRVVVSPGIAASHPLVRLARERGLPVEGEMAFGLRQLPPCWKAGITGTNGKTTVTEMASWCIAAQRQGTVAAGNIGVPVTALASSNTITSPVQNLVLELSSYQLEDLSGPWLDAGVWLNLTPDHLDRYVTMEAYARAKARIADCLAPGGSLLVGDSVLQEWAEVFHGLDKELVSFGSPASDLYWHGNQLIWKERNVATFCIDELAPHDLDNLAAAAWIAHRAGIDWQLALDHASTFRKGPHRCELVAMIRGVRWVNDSKGTNLDAVIKASQAFPPGQILIAGGVHKGAPYTPWIDGLQGRVRQILAIGQAAGQIEHDLRDRFPVEQVGSLDQAIHRAQELAADGDTVLLSPGCSSFDQFRDYAHRGEVFRSSVLQLARTSDTVKTVGS
jgi:UDP-N-acetylmuramoylalanine--D-glutamate ligase